MRYEVNSLQIIGCNAKVEFDTDLECLVVILYLEDANAYSEYEVIQYNNGFLDCELLNSDMLEAPNTYKFQLK